MDTCGFCRGTGLTPGRKYDREGRPTDGPDLILCEYCCGAGQCEDGGKLLPARLQLNGDYGPEAHRLFG